MRRRRPVKRPKAPRIPTRPPVEPRLVRRLCLAIILVIAFLTRVLPARWGPPYHLTGNDPFFQYRSADYVIRNGVQAYFSWLDDMAWHPYGRYIGRTSYPTLPFAAALFYAVVSALGAPVSLYEFCAAFPVLAGVATCLALYAFAEYVGGTETGLLAALFLALCSSHIQRTEFGFFDDESMGVLLLTGLSLLYLRSIEPRLTLRRRLLYGVACGLTLGCLITEWGAHRYALDLLGLFMALVVLLRRYSPSMILPYAATIGVASPFALALPRHGLRGFTSVDWAFLAGVLLVLCLLWARGRFGRRGRALTYALLIAAVATVLALVAAGHVRLPTGKFLAVVNPFHRKEIPIIESVAEHRTTSWDAFYLHMGVLLFLIPVGLYHAARRLGARDIYLIAYGVSSIFFAGSMVRLLLIAAPATCTIAALGVTSTVSPFIDVVRRGPTLPRRLRPRVGVAFSVVLPLTLLALILLPEPTGLVWSTRYVGTPSTLVASSTPKRERVGDWLEALEWIRENTPPDAVIASWWDYGYWITVMGNRTTVVDNATINSTQIAQIGRMFLSNESEAVEILRRYGVSHVVVFCTYDENGRFLPWPADNCKWYWMARIAGLDWTRFGARGWWGTPTEEGMNTTIYKMMRYGMEEHLGLERTVALERFELAYVSPSNGYVIIYRVRYE